MIFSQNISDIGDKEQSFGAQHGAFLTVSALKGTAILMISKFYMKKLYEPWILIPVLSKSVEKYESYGRLNICKWTLMEADIL